MRIYHCHGTMSTADNDAEDGCNLLRLSLGRGLLAEQPYGSARRHGDRRPVRAGAGAEQELGVVPAAAGRRGRDLAVVGLVGHPVAVLAADAAGRSSAVTVTFGIATRSRPRARARRRARRSAPRRRARPALSGAAAGRGRAACGTACASCRRGRARMTAPPSLGCCASRARSGRARARPAPRANARAARRPNRPAARGRARRPRGGQRGTRRRDPRPGRTTRGP